MAQAKEQACAKEQALVEKIGVLDRQLKDNEAKVRIL